MTVVDTADAARDRRYRDAATALARLESRKVEWWQQLCREQCARRDLMADVRLAREAGIPEAVIQANVSFTEHQRAEFDRLQEADKR